MSRIYLASSWRNKHQEHVLRMLRWAGHEVYDFKNPEPGNTGFGWSKIDPNWQQWSPEEFRDALQHPIARKGYRLDKKAIDWCTMGVLLLPSGMSAHLEAGWIGGSGKPVCVYMPELKEPELMYNFFAEAEEQRVGDCDIETICLTEAELFEFVSDHPARHIPHPSHPNMFVSKWDVEVTAAKWPWQINPTGWWEKHDEDENSESSGAL